MSEPVGYRLPFSYFVSANKAAFKAKNGDASAQDLMLELGKAWRVLGSDERSQYTAMTAADKARYTTEHAAWSAANPSAATASDDGAQDSSGESSSETSSSNGTPAVGTSRRRRSGASTARRSNASDLKALIPGLAGLKPASASASSKKKRKRRKKDPNRPKGLKNAYMYFSIEKRDEVKAGLSDVGGSAVQKALGVLWAQTSEADRAKYQVMADADKVRYTTEMAAYKERLLKEPAEAAASSNDEGKAGVAVKQVSRKGGAAAAATAAAAGPSLPTVKVASGVGGVAGGAAGAGAGGGGASSSDGGDGTKPERVRNPFQFFCEDVRGRDGLKDVPGKDHYRVLGEQWKALPDAQRAVFEAMAEEDKKRFIKETKDFWEDRSGGSSEVDRAWKMTEPDPRAPKPPVNSYMLFSKENRDKLTAANPDVPARQLFALVSAAWKNAEAEVREEYSRRARLLQDQYKAEWAAYEAAFPEAAKVEKRRRLAHRRKKKGKKGKKKTVGSTSASSRRKLAGSGDALEGSDGGIGGLADFLSDDSFMSDDDDGDDDDNGKAPTVVKLTLSAPAKPVEGTGPTAGDKHPHSGDDDGEPDAKRQRVDGAFDDGSTPT